jgi:DNA-binding MarR family transcriptional regulator
MRPIITASQRRYILALKDGPKSSHDIRLAVIVTSYSVNRMMKRLENLGLVKSRRVPYANGRRWQYELTERRVTCPECGREFVTKLRIGELEWKDGWHGECPGPHCGFWYFGDL